MLKIKWLGNPVIRDSGEKEEEEEDDDSDSSELDEELYNDPATQEIIKTLVLWNIVSYSYNI